jgi:hypothetical protein
MQRLVTVLLVFQLGVSQSCTLVELSQGVHPTVLSVPLLVVVKPPTQGVQALAPLALCEPWAHGVQTESPAAE